MFDEFPAMALCAEEELVRRAQRNDQAAFAELMRRTSATSFRLAMSVLRHLQDAEDEVQNSYWNAWRNVGQFQGDSKFSTWISRIVLNQSLMRLRKMRTAKFLYVDRIGDGEESRPLEIADPAGTPETNLAAGELPRAVRREIRKLPPLMREVLILRDIEELPAAEVAQRLNISVSAVKSRLFRARSELRGRLERQRECGASGFRGTGPSTFASTTPAYSI